MIKVLFVIGLTEGGGAERRALRISTLLKSKLDTKVLAFSGNKIENIEYIFKDTYCEYKNTSIKERVSFLRDKINEYGPDIVISFMPHISYFTTLALRGNDSTKHIVSIVNTRFSFKSNLLLKYSIKQADSIYYQCDEQKNFVKTQGKPSFVIFNPIEIPQKIHHKERFNFLSVGRLEKQKNFAFLIEAFPFILKKFPNSTFDIYGNGSQKNALEKKINKLNLKCKVKIHDFQSNLNEVYSNHDIFLYAPIFEGFPNVLAEAMSYNLICFTTHFKTGCEELILNEKTGHICPKKNVKMFSQLVIDKLENYDNEIRIAENGFELVERNCSYTLFREKMFYEIDKMLR